MALRSWPGLSPGAWPRTCSSAKPGGSSSSTSQASHSSSGTGSGRVITGSQ
ncbi:MAG TPA: hypothetical protein VFW50_43725 [Streptosporangiaceae bacterium]|nr:hypothetical protein [Streptosporangiaceae bacterium]